MSVLANILVAAAELKYKMRPQENVYIQVVAFINLQSDCNQETAENESENHFFPGYLPFFVFLTLNTGSIRILVRLRCTAGKNST